MAATDFLFDPPFWAPMAVAAASVVCLFAGNRRTDKTLKNVGLGLALLSVAFWVIATVMKTDKEIVAEQSRALTASVNARDWAKFESLLDPKAQLRPLFLDKQTFVQGAKATVERFDVQDISILSLELDDSRPGALVANVQVMAKTDQSSTIGRPFRTNWQFFWSKNGETWQCYEVMPVAGGDIPDTVIQQSLTRGVPDAK